MSRLDEEQTAFMEKHNAADLIECSTITGQVIRVIYYSPKSKVVNSSLEEFFQTLQEDLTNRNE